MSTAADIATCEIAGPTADPMQLIERMWHGRDLLIATIGLTGILAHLALRYVTGPIWLSEFPLLVILAAGGVPLALALVWEAAHGRFGSDQLAGVSIVASALLGQYLAGSIVVLMLSGGETVQRFAVGRATAALRALASRVPTVAHRRRGGAQDEIPVQDVRIDDELSILPHEVCPVDGEVIQGHGAMDESYLTGEPFTIPKGPGSRVTVRSTEWRICPRYPSDADRGGFALRPSHASHAGR